MANDPSFVRLANRLSRGMLADVQVSGWSIAGLDVRKFPKDDPQAAKFVRSALNSGKLEPASKAEWDDVHDDEEFAAAVLRQNPDFGSSPQEAQIQRAAEAARRKVEESRRDERSQEEVYDEEVRQPRKQRAQSSVPDDLDDLSKKELQDLAKRLGLPASGNMDDIRDRIEDYQASLDDDEENDEEQHDEEQ